MFNLFMIAALAGTGYLQGYWRADAQFTGGGIWPDLAMLTLSTLGVWLLTRR